MRKLLLQIIFIFASYVITFAQDGLYSSFYATPLYLNPGLTGVTDATFRMGGIYRSQWQAIQTPYQNYNFYFDKNNEHLSYGILMNQNTTSGEGLKTTNGLFSIALKKKLAEGNNFLSFGLQLGLLQHSFDFSKLTFDNQYNPEKGYDADLESGEDFDGTSILLPDVNLGINYRFSKDLGIPINGNLGISFSHVNKPRSTFLNENIQFPLKSTIYGMIELEFSPQFGIEPYLLFQGQQTARQFVFGTNLAFTINDFAKLKVGIGKREHDGLILSSSIHFKNVILGLSYDTHLSELERPVQGRSFELSLTYLIGKEETPEKPKEEKKLANPFSSIKDYDSDGVSDENDLCPFEAGSPEFQGCDDSDKDGIWDHLDACPSLPGKVENYGCPMKEKGLDSDKDGVPDREDLCIYIPGLKELLGCPDSDGDGISDDLDDCPYVKGTSVNKGCPTDKADLKVQSGLLEFATDDATIQGRYFPVLDKIAFQLLNNQALRLIVEGHTDDEGNHLYNHQLSKKRAVTVQKYLLEKGVPEEQMELHFYGETKPVIARYHTEARKRNRRVVLILTD